MGLYKKEQCFVVVAAALLLTGAVFMLVNIFGNQPWALWTGFGFLIAAVLLYGMIQIQHLQFNRKYTAKESVIKAAVGKETETKTADQEKVKAETAKKSAAKSAGVNKTGTGNAAGKSDETKPAANKKANK